MFLQFSVLLDQLYFTNSTRQKEAILAEYLAVTPDPERGYALASLVGALRLPGYRRARVKEWLLARVDPTLFAMSYDYVGELAETVAHLWPTKASTVVVDSLTLSQLVAVFSQKNNEEAETFLCACLDGLAYQERWALLKFLGSSMRVGLSLRACKRVLAEYGGKTVVDIERVWHGVLPPYEDLFAWLAGDAGESLTLRDLHFTPAMLANPGDSELLASLDWSEFLTEWKYDGIRVQYVQDEMETWCLYTRTGEDITNSFPDLGCLADHAVVLDGELLVGAPDAIADFGALQQRLGKRKPSIATQKAYPVLLMAYDMLKLRGDWLLDSSLKERRRRLQVFFADQNHARLQLSPRLAVTDYASFLSCQAQSLQVQVAPVEGLMVKRLDSLYVSGRPRGAWWKCKRDPYYLDCVLVYAQRGHGKRSSLFSDFTFAVWEGDDLVPIGKAYSGFTDEELTRLQKWVRANTIARFGPMTQLRPDLVVEVAFDRVMVSPRRKAGFSLRFPRIHRIRWDKPIAEANTLACVQALASPPASG
jgi:DNA ligase-1